MQLKKIAYLIIALTLLLTACSNKTETTEKKEQNEKKSENLNATGMPIVKEPIKLNFFNGKAAATAPDWNDILSFNTYEDLSNIDIEWEMVPYEGLTEKRNLALASDNLPDAFHNAQVPGLDLLKYGQQGVFLKLNDLIDQYAPNLKKLFEQYPEIKKGLTFPDGSIYSMPTVYAPDFYSVLIGSKLWYRQDWLEKLGIEEPKTTEEFYQYLKAVKETDLNGNGKNDEIPYGALNMSALRDWLKGSFGIGNRGMQHDFVDMDPETNKLRFYPISDGNKEMLQYLNKLYSEGLIQSNIFSIEHSQFYSTAGEGLYASLSVPNTDYLLGDAAKYYIGSKVLAGPNGEHKLAQVRSPLVNIGSFVITSANKNPAATVRWMDYFYGDEGAKLFFMGVEGETFEVAEDGSLQYLDKINNSADGLTVEQELAKYVTWMGGGYPGIVKQEFFKGGATLPSSIEATEKLVPDLIDEVWPPFTHTLEESRDLTALAADIEKYVIEMQDKFIHGDVPFSEWDKYVKTIKNMGLDDYMSIKQAAYDRYVESE